MHLFWLSVVVGVLSNLATGLLLASVFETLQRRRDLQRQLDEVWLLATRATEAVNHSRLRKDGGAEAYGLWLALQDEWLRARHSLNFALTEEKRKQLEESISAIYELHILNSDKRNRKYLKLHPIELVKTEAVPSDPPKTAEYVDFGTWATRNDQPEAKAAFEEFQAQKKKLNQKIDDLLNFDPFVSARSGPEAGGRSLASGSAQTWHFGFLFSRVWKWFFSEFFYSFSEFFQE